MKSSVTYLLVERARFITGIVAFVIVILPVDVNGWLEALVRHLFSG